MCRDLADGVDDGPDVRQLEENLVALGFADPAVLTVDEEFTDATADAVERWQEALGIDETGKVARSQVVFMLGPVRVAERKVQPGAEANGEVLTVTGSTQQVHVDLATDLAELVSVGDVVDVELPDGSIASGTVTSVGTAVETEQDQMGGSTSTLPVTVQLAGDAGGLDDAPVDVSLCAPTPKERSRVPVRALLALAEGGYRRRASCAGGATELVAVELGEFARTASSRWRAREGDELA